MKIFIYSLLFLILFSLYAKLHVCIKYAMNMDYYATVLCENKNVKKSCCKGKCAMGKELVSLNSKEDEQQNKTPGAILKFSKAEEAVYRSFNFKVQNTLVGSIKSPFILRLDKGSFKTLLRPPIV